MESCLGDKIEGWCGGLERRVDESEHRVEEHLVSLEMVHTKLEVGCADLEKRIDGLALEVNRVKPLLQAWAYAESAEQGGDLWFWRLEFSFWSHGNSGRWGSAPWCCAS
jgi:hypothetical protein